jgi:integrase
VEFFGTQIVIADQIREVTTEDIEDFRNRLVDQQVKPNTINRKLTSLRSFFKRCVGLRILDHSPTELVKGFKTCKTAVGKAIDTEILETILEDAKDKSDPYMSARDVALITVLLFAGLRRSEASNMQWSHIISDGGIDVLILPDTKSGMQQHVKLAKRAKDALDRLREYTHPDDTYVFTSLSLHQRYGEQLRPDSINRILKKYGRDAGVNLSAHSFRHTCCTLALEGGATVQQAQAHLRHADIETTMRYYEDRNKLEDNATDYILKD